MSSATVTMVLACSVGDKERPVSSCAQADRLPSGLLPGWWDGARGMAEVSGWDQSASHRWALKRQQEGASLGAQVWGWCRAQAQAPGPPHSLGACPVLSEGPDPRAWPNLAAAGTGSLGLFDALNLCRVCCLWRSRLCLKREAWSAPDTPA